MPKKKHKKVHWLRRWLNKWEKLEQKLLRIWLKVNFQILSWRKFSALILGLLLVAALPPYDEMWLIFPIFSLALYLCCQTTKLRTLCALGYWFGFGFFAAGFYWIGNALLIDIAQTGWLYPLVLGLNGAFFGIFAILPFAATKICQNIYGKMMLFAAVWGIATEWFRGIFLTGFPWNPISSVLTASPAMLQTLAIWGTYGLSVVLILIAAFPAVFLVKQKRKYFYLSLLSFVAFAGLWEYGEFVLMQRPQVNNGEAIIVRLVQPSIPQALKWDKNAAENNLQNYINLSNGQDNQHIDFTIWGETASPYDFTYDEKHLQKIRSAVPLHGYLISGFLRYEYADGRYIPFNSMAVINRRAEVVATYDKNHLVPFGEYIPLRQYLPEWVRPVAGNIAEFGRGKQFKTIQIAGYPEFAPLICYEIIFSNQTVAKKEHPQWMVLLTNDGWYGISSGPYQHLAAAQMRAVEEGVSIVRSANSGISAVINPYGEITAQMYLGQRGFMDAVVKPSEARSTFFGSYGNYPFFFMCASLIFAALILARKSRK